MSTRVTPSNAEHPLALLQRTVGNRAVAETLQRTATEAAASTCLTCTYHQTSGKLTCNNADGKTVVDENGYSGAGDKKNDPKSQCVKNEGPLPRGSYTVGAARKSNTPTVFTIPLTPAAANEMCRRGSFLIHGDSVAKPGTASEGCIIVSKTSRKTIAAAGCGTLEVVEK